jgi:hypothetical protein
MHLFAAWAQQPSTAAVFGCAIKLEKRTPRISRLLRHRRERLSWPKNAFGSAISATVILDSWLTSERMRIAVNVAEISEKSADFEC